MQQKVSEEGRKADVPEHVDNREAERERCELDMILSSSSSSEDMESDASFVGKN